MVGLSKARILL